MGKNPLLIVVIVLIIALVILAYFTYDIFNKATECKAGLDQCLAGVNECTTKATQCKTGLDQCIEGVGALQEVLIGLSQVPACAPYIPEGAF